MMRTEDLCMGCMNEKLYSGPCEICGTDNAECRNPAGTLPVGTLLADRYLIGKLLSKNGEGCVYIAYDTAENRKADIKEFMPDALCVRKDDGKTIEVLEGSLPLYKSYLSEFSDLHKTIMSSIGKSCLRKVYGIFAAGNTGCVVMEHPEGVPLLAYLEEKGGRLSWEAAKTLFPPVFDTLTKMHSKGIIHRGLSPQTIYAGNDGELTITSLGISAVRSADSMINCEMYPGYAACEQYSLSERQGSWTDVYGLCAVLYRTLTGIDPPPADEREKNDSLKEPRALEEDIPETVSDTIMQGLSTNWNDRIHTIEQLYAGLYSPKPKSASEAEPPQDEPEEDPGPITPAVPASVRKIQEHTPEPDHKKPKKITRKEKEKKEKARANAGVIVGLVIFFLLVIGLLSAMLFFSNQEQDISAGTVTEKTTAASTEPPETEPPVTTAATKATTTAATKERLLMPNFVNRFFNSALENRYSSLIFETEYEYTADFQKGIIFEQDVAEGTMVTAGTTIKLKISSGPESVALPDFVGLKLSQYAERLNEAGIKYVSEELETSEFKPGYVAKCSKEPGQQVWTSKDEVITVYYAITPVVTTTVTEAAAPEPEESEDEEVEDEEVEDEEIPDNE